MERRYRNPFPTVDIIIEVAGGIVLIERKNEPYGWAIPGGFLDWGESVEACALREAKEETSLDVTLKQLFYVYSNPSRDPRHHTVTTVFLAGASGKPRAADDAKKAEIYLQKTLPKPLVFDHAQILEDYFRFRKGESKEAIFHRYMNL